MASYERIGDVPRRRYRKFIRLLWGTKLGRWLA